ncbi:MAG: hypothetical protein ACYCZD_07140 [Rhodanobacter sp.]
MLLLVLTIVTLSTMPRWAVHSHDGNQASGFVLTADQTIEHHVANADVPDKAPSDVSHTHVHYLTGADFTLPALFADVHQLNLSGNHCPPWRNALTPQGLLATLHRPPIA